MQSPASTFADLLQRIHAGDRDAEGDLTRRISQGITQVAVKHTGNFALAQEICQETLIILLTRLRSEPLRDPEKVSAFVAQTARNLAIAEHRKQARRKTETGSDSIEEVEDTSQAQDRDIERESAAVAIRAVLDEMPNPRDRTLLVRYYLHDEEKQAICEDLSMSEASFNVVLFRARSRFLEMLQKRGLRAADFMSLVLL